MTSVAVVVCDTLRKDAFDDAFDWLPGLRYEQAYSTSHWTIPAHASLYTGYYPSEVGVHAKSHRLDCDVPTLAESLSAAGYRTRLFTAQPQIYVWDGWTRGFDETASPATLPPEADDTFDWTAFQMDCDASGVESYACGAWRCLRGDEPTLGSLRNGVRLVRQSAAEGGSGAILDRVRATEFGDDEFLVANLMDAHIPYIPPDDGEPVSVTSGDGFADAIPDPDRVRRAYAASVDHLSEMYREIFDELRSSFDYVVTLSDHGELLGEDGQWNHGYGLRRELAHVPLAVSGRGVPSGTCDATVSLLDVHRTVAELAGVDVASRGQHLLDGPKSRDCLVEYHGFVPWMRGQFEREAIPDGFFEKRDEPRRGFAAADGGYAHQTHGDGWRAEGRPGDPDARLASLRDALAEQAIEQGVTEVSEGVRSRLAELGYA